MTNDGSHTLKHCELGELYHSTRGAIGESLHVFIEAGLRHVIRTRTENDRSMSSDGDNDPISIFEVGFGSGLNALLTLTNSDEGIDYHAIEQYPIALETAALLNYTDYNPTMPRESLFMDLHSANWGESVPITPNFKLTKYNNNIQLFDFEPLHDKFDIIYFDAFSPEVQPELWREQMMRSMYNILKNNGILVTYSSKGLVKQALRAVGFEVTRLEGALGKRHMLRAIKR